MSETSFEPQEVYGHRVTFFDRRPEVGGGTVYIRPEAVSDASLEVTGTATPGAEAVGTIALQPCDIAPRDDD